MKRFSVFLLCCWLTFSTFAWGESFQAAVLRIQTAITTKNMPVLTRHIALEKIVANKIKKYSHKAESKGSITLSVAGKLVNLSEPLLTKMVANIVLREYGKASPAYINSYTSTLKFSKIGEKDNYGYAGGSFMGSRGLLSGLKNDKGEWIIVDVESPIIDRELNSLMKKLKVIK